MSRLLLLTLALILARPAIAWTQDNPGTSSAAEEVRQAIRQYRAALMRRDTATVSRYWAPDYTFVNPFGERLTRDARMANFRSARTAFDTVGATRDENIRVYGGNVAVMTSRVMLGGKYSGQTHRGDYQSLIVWVKRDGQWQQVASQVTRIAAP